MRKLKEERQTAANIKDRTNRQNTQKSSQMIISHLQSMKSIPPTGIALFCGPHYSIVNADRKQGWV